MDFWAALVTQMREKITWHLNTIATWRERERERERENERKRKRERDEESER